MICAHFGLVSVDAAVNGERGCAHQPKWDTFDLGTVPVERLHHNAHRLNLLTVPLVKALGRAREISAQSSPAPLAEHRSTRKSVFATSPSGVKRRVRSRMIGSGSSSK